MQQYANTEKSIPEIARELNVETVMEGSVRYAGGQIRITAQLNDGITGAHLWSETYTRDFDDIFAIESDVAMNVANAVGAEFSLEEQASIERVPTESSEAYRFYLAALEANSRNNTNVAFDLLDRAIDIDPNFALAYAARAQGISGVLPRTFGETDGPNRVVEQEALALQDVQTALMLDPELAWAHVVLANIADFNWKGAEARAAFERALELSPNDPVILSSYASFEARTGEGENAIRMKRRAMELDPTQGESGALFENIGDLDSAASAYRRSVELNPNDGGVSGVHLALVEIIRGNYAVAESTLRLVEPAARRVGNAVMVPQIAYAYSRLGLEADAERLLEFYDEFSVSQKVSAANRVIMSLARGDEVGALQWLTTITERAPYEGHRAVLRIKKNVFHDPILDKPEFVALREQLGFTDL